jgi:hypothetical protein
LTKKLFLLLTGLFLVGIGPSAADARTKRAKTVRLSHKLKSGQVVRAKFVLPDGWRVEQSGSQRPSNAVSLRRHSAKYGAVVSIMEEENTIATAIGFGRRFSAMGCQVKVLVEEAVARQGITKVTVRAECGRRIAALAIVRAFPGRKKVTLAGLVIMRGSASQGESILKALSRARLR